MNHENAHPNLRKDVPGGLEKTKAPQTKPVALASEIFDSISNWSGAELRQFINHFAKKCNESLMGKMEAAEKGLDYCRNELDYCRNELHNFENPVDGPLDQSGHE